jgi:DNA polymerase-3 subunit epsilon
MRDDELEAMAEALEASGRYRILRRLQPRSIFEGFDGSETRLGIFLDLETTGLNPLRDEIIEFAMVPFTYGLDGRIFETHEPFARLREPSIPIPPEVTALTGIDAATVKGQSIDAAEVMAFAAPATLIIAHNAAFDRRFAERFSEVFVAKPWACSMTEVNWSAEGFESRKLSYLANAHGFYFDGHRAIDDCHAAIEVLARPLRSSGRTAFAAMLGRARRSLWRIWAENSPYDQKDQLKARGYRWNGEANGAPRAWYVDVSDDQRDAEILFLRENIYRSDIKLPIREMTAYNRYSDRV